ncbi:hypothetical protein PR048_033321 [Dryococelus australis]|uniref:Uncharacterized protein n=1 Tax=Dryococelus australis TaxID=614101 RepID=A0ABQ9G453_9NEOP|nr:hypothetical protein PR048_033321 [Dryococelus australis]
MTNVFQRNKCNVSSDNNVNFAGRYTLVMAYTQDERQGRRLATRRPRVFSGCGRDLSLGKIYNSPAASVRQSRSGIEAAMIAHNGRYHQSCKLKYNNTMLNRAKTDKVCQKTNVPLETKRVRYTSPATAKEATCFFYNTGAGLEGLHDADTFELDARVRTCARLVEDNDLSGRLSAGDMVTPEAKFHTSCLLQLYNKARKPKSGESEPNNHEKSLHAYILAELVMHIEEVCADDETSAVSKLADLADLYLNRLNQLGVQIDGRVHTTRLKQRVLAHFPDMRAYAKGRDTILAFNEDVGSSLIKVCEFGSDNDAVQLAHSAQIVSRVMFGGEKRFTGFLSTCQQESVPPLLLGLVEDNSTAALTIAQFLKFSSIKYRRTRTLPSHRTVRHSQLQETPDPINLGLILHARTQKGEIIEKLYSLGISVSYDSVLQMSTQLGNDASIKRQTVNCRHRCCAAIYVSYAQGLPVGNELWLAFGTEEHFRYLAAHNIAAGIGSDKSPALPLSHALTVSNMFCRT